MGRASKIKLNFLKNKYFVSFFLSSLTILTRLPIAFDGKLRWNLARTAPLLPCGRVTLPQITLM